MGNTISISQTFPYTREKVFSAFEDPAVLAKWWGPDGFTNIFYRFDFVNGGEWKFTMHSPDGYNFDCNHRFVEISKPEKFVFDHLQDGHNFRGSYELDDKGEETQVTFTMTFEDAEELARVRQFVEPANEQNFNRLRGILAA
ncbi:polyketide cyclase [Mucilaginibacter conchicola]|uniref:Polyketide cyclase n=1 Tax=Mucilaginibacter conchicola TaxID=2303333 RepID=A0A372NXC6_9SPHI|nr:SRPBCC domain-containing protein [Mucilaginibacter conchicola]RFZ94766.1 polyketide cyclase [Mucilaginibacter conchicola]